jgi:hypothetical protein
MCLRFEFGIHFCLGSRQLLKKQSRSLQLIVCLVQKYIKQDEETVLPSSTTKLLKKVKTSYLNVYWI